MIPKKIHYCWFGGNPLPEDAQKCIASWRKYLPDYEIVEWNESNFDVNSIPYTAQAYTAKKYAFVSDYARFWILYHHGGVYFDTDVEVIKPMDDIIASGPFIGIEKSLATQKPNSGGWVGINPGLGIGAVKGDEIYREILAKYASMDFDINGGTVVKHTTDIFHLHGFDGTNRLQKVGNITVYPDDVFCPMDSTTGLLYLTDDSRSIHHYSCTWMDRKSFSFRLHLLKNQLIKIFGAKMVMGLSRIIKKG